MFGLKSSSPESDCLYLVEEEISQVVSEVRQCIELAGVNFEATSIDKSLYVDLGIQLRHYILKSFILELRQAKSNNLLVGDTPEDRYSYFLDALSDDRNKDAFFERYPVLKEKIEEYLNFYLQNNKEMITRLQADIADIRKAFGKDQKLILCGIQYCGDPHNHLRRVAILKFTCADEDADFKIVYKPRPVVNDDVFNAILDFLNMQSQTKLRTLVCLRREAYGWCEYISQVTCDREEQVNEFYYKFGMLVAIIYGLGIHDMHYENLIANASDPVIIDLECFGPAISAYINPELYRHTVLNSGMLIDYQFERNGASDASAFGGGGPESEIAFLNSYLKNPRTDNACFSRRGGSFSLQENRCLLHGEPVNPYAYKGDVIEGFKYAYRLLLHHREKLLAQFRDRFADIHVRTIFRSTYIYMKLFNESFHPSLLKSHQQYCKHLEWLQENNSRVQLSEAQFESLVQSEISQLQNQDIPLFFIYGDSIYDPYGARILGGLALTPQNAIISKLESLSNDDKCGQLSIISKNLDLYALNFLSKKRETHSDSELNSGFESSNCLESAKRLLDALLEDAISLETWEWPEHEVVSGIQNDKQYWLMKFSGHNLYSGSIGIMLVIFYLFKITGTLAYERLVDSALLFLKGQITELSRKTISPDLSLFTGIGGWLYFLVKAGSLKKTACKPLIKSIIAVIEDNIDTWLLGYHLDIISGVAGLILVLNLALESQLETEKTKQLILKCQAFLLDKYPCPSKLPEEAYTENNKMTVVGFSHGLSGICYALYIANNVFADERAMKWIRQGLDYERNTFSVKYQSWPNTYSLQIEPPITEKAIFQTDWCHGSLGVGLSRLLMKKRNYSDEMIDSEIAISILHIVNGAERKALNLCHGQLGNLDFAQILLDEGSISSETMTKLKRDVLAKLFSEQVPTTEVYPEVFIPGIMTGKAGLIYSLLRMSYPDQVDSILAVS